MDRLEWKTSTRFSQTVFLYTRFGRGTDVSWGLQVRGVPGTRRGLSVSLTKIPPRPVIQYLSPKDTMYETL